METYCAVVTAEDPHAWTLQNNLGIMLKRHGHFAQSEACFRQALQDNPNYVPAYVNLANTLAAAGDPAAAQTEYRRANLLLQAAPR
jgi:Flp pilus assembly protein TadD